MLRELHCIALRTIKYNERHSILSAYSLEVGRVSFLVPAGAGKEALIMMLIASYVMYFSLEDAGEKLGRETDAYKSANERYEALRGRISGVTSEYAHINELMLNFHHIK